MSKQAEVEKAQQVAINVISADVTFTSKKADKVETVQLGTLPESSIMAIIRYGAQRFINDKLGGSDVTQAEAEKKFSDIMAQLREGWVDRRGQGGGSVADPVEKEARKMAKDRVKAALKAKGISLKDVKKEKLAELTEGVFEKNQKELMEKAKQVVEVQSSTLSGADVDLGDLGL